jgi:uncharacterized protein YbcV (DUF1398 family)
MAENVMALILLGMVAGVKYNGGMNMFDQEKISAIQKKAAENKWPFHYLFNSFKAMGIDRIETNVLTCEVKYVGGGSSMTEKSPEGFTPLVAAAEFDAEAIKLASAKWNAREVTYVEFLELVAAAGVSFFRVDMRPRTMTYHGARPKDKYVEKVQES